MSDDVFDRAVALGIRKARLLELRENDEGDEWSEERAMLELAAIDGWGEPAYIFRTESLEATLKTISFNLTWKKK